MTPNPKIQRTVKPQTENEWEEKILSEALNDAINDEGHIDFDKLRSRGTNLNLEELYTDEENDES